MSQPYTKAAIVLGICTAFIVSYASCGGGAREAAPAQLAAASISLSATSLSFGSQPVQTSSSAQSVTLTNTGSATLNISGLAVTGTNAGDFTEVDTCGTPIVAGAQCTVAVMFTPSAAGTRTAALSISDNANGSPQTVNLTGTAAHDIVLAWTASPTSGATYNVYRGTSSGGESTTPLSCQAISATSCADVNITAGTTYYYVVTAVVSYGSTQVQSAPTNEVAATAL